MELLEVLITLHTSQTVNTWGATTGTVSVPTTADTIAESNETFTIASGTASATGTINDNDAAPTVATITPASATEGSPAVFEFSLSNPSAIAVDIPLHSPMELLEVLITLLQR
jgi:hypothetical protein